MGKEQRDGEQIWPESLSKVSPITWIAVGVLVLFLGSVGVYGVARNCGSEDNEGRNTHTEAEPDDTNTATQTTKLEAARRRMIQNPYVRKSIRQPDKARLGAAMLALRTAKHWGNAVATGNYGGVTLEQAWRNFLHAKWTWSALILADYIDTGKPRKMVNAWADQCIGVTLLQGMPSDKALARTTFIDKYVRTFEPATN